MIYVTANVAKQANSRQDNSLATFHKRYHQAHRHFSQRRRSAKVDWLVTWPLLS